ncbi:hypothetical protein CPC08DRAFT_459215 [Agrocybe pediades]|nr:hypothetical protein CPC08DRAFT_459215 [Agrocybe pediades]
MLPPECETGEPYNPFKLDVWQLGAAFEDFRTTLPSFDMILDEMKMADWKTRKNASDTLNTLRTAVYSVPPQSLLIQPKTPHMRLLYKGS